MIKYFAVVYCTDGTIHLEPKDTQKECLEKLKKMSEDPRVRKRMACTTVIKREMNNFKEGRIFGNPKSLNVIK